MWLTVHIFDDWLDFIVNNSAEELPKVSTNNSKVLKCLHYQIKEIAH